MPRGSLVPLSSRNDPDRYRIIRCLRKRDAEFAADRNRDVDQIRVVETPLYGMVVHCFVQNDRKIVTRENILSRICFRLVTNFKTFTSWSRVAL